MSTHPESQYVKSWQIFYCELKNGKWWQGKRPVVVRIDKDKAERTLKLLQKNASPFQKYVMVEV